MTTKFNGQVVIRSHRLKELTKFYEILKPTYPHQNDYEENLKLLHKWADWLENVKKRPFAMVIEEYEKGKMKIALLVFGEKKQVTD